MNDSEAILSLYFTVLLIPPVAGILNLENRLEMSAFNTNPLGF